MTTPEPPVPAGSLPPAQPLPPPPPPVFAAPGFPVRAAATEPQFELARLGLQVVLSLFPP